MVILICDFLMISEVEHICGGLVASQYLLLCFQLFCPILCWVLFLFLLIFRSSLYISDRNLFAGYKYPLSLRVFPFYSFLFVYRGTEILYLEIFVSYLRGLCLLQCPKPKDVYTYFLKRILRSAIQLELIVVYGMKLRSRWPSKQSSTMY